MNVKREPVVVAFVAAAVALAAALGWTPSNDFVNAATDALSAAVSVVAILKARSKVTPV